MNDPIYGSTLEFTNLYLNLGRKDRASEIILATCQDQLQLMRWYLSMSNRNLRRSARNFSDAASLEYSYIFPLLQQCVDKAQYDEIFVDWQNMCDDFERRMN